MITRSIFLDSGGVKNSSVKMGLLINSNLLENDLMVDLHEFQKNGLISNYRICRKK